MIITFSVGCCAECPYFEGDDYCTSSGYCEKSGEYVENSGVITDWCVYTST